MVVLFPMPACNRVPAGAGSSGIPKKLENNTAKVSGKSSNTWGTACRLLLRYYNQYRINDTDAHCLTFWRRSAAVTVALLWSSVGPSTGYR